MTILFINGATPESLLKFAALAIILGWFLYKKLSRTVNTMHERLHESIEYHGQIFVFRKIQGDDAVVEKCIEKDRAFYSQIKNAYYYHDKWHGKGIWVPCFMTPQQRPLLVVGSSSVFHKVKPNSLFKVVSRTGQPFVIEKIKYDEGVFIENILLG